MTSLRIEGEIASPAIFSAEDLAAFPDAERVGDVRDLGATREGSGVYLQAILGRVRPAAGVRYITLHAPNDDFWVSIPLEPPHPPESS